MAYNFISKVLSFFGGDAGIDTDQNCCVGEGGDNGENDNSSSDEDEKLESYKRYDNKNVVRRYSYVLTNERIVFGHDIDFLLYYLIKNSQLWLLGVDFAANLGFSQPVNAIHACVDKEHKCLLDTLVCGDKAAAVNEDNDAKSPVCLNRQGTLQLLNYIQFKTNNKAEFTAYLMDKIADLQKKAVRPLVSVTDQKLAKILNAVETLRCNDESLIESNKEFKNEVIHKFSCFEARFGRFQDQLAELDKKVSVYENINQLYDKLKEHHHKKHLDEKAANGVLNHAGGGNSNSYTSFSMFDEGNNSGGGDSCRYESVRFPRDVTKHPRLTVYAKPDQEGTKLTFVAGQKTHTDRSKRKYRDMELLYDSIHPNPQLAVHCLNEELESRDFNCKKRTKREYYLNCSMDTVRSFISENV